MHGKDRVTTRAPGSSRANDTAYCLRFVHLQVDPGLHEGSKASIAMPIVGACISLLYSGRVGQLLTKDEHISKASFSDVA